MNVERTGREGRVEIAWCVRGWWREKLNNATDEHASTCQLMREWPRRLVNHGSSKKGKGFPYSIPSVGPGADPGVQAVSLQVTVSHPPGGRLPLLSARLAVTSPAAEHHRPLAGTKLYCLVTEAHRYEQLAQGCYAALSRVGFEPATYWSQVRRSTVTLPRHLDDNALYKFAYLLTHL